MFFIITLQSSHCWLQEVELRALFNLKHYGPKQTSSFSHDTTVPTCLHFLEDDIFGTALGGNKTLDNMSYYVLVARIQII